MRRPSRLWRLLGADQPLFTLWSEDTLGPITDERIKSVTIHRGSSTPQYGPQIDTMEVSTTLGLGVHTDKRIHFDLTAYGAGILYQRCGALVGPTTPRYFGRVGKMSMDDTWQHQHATIYAASWHAQLSNTKVPMTVPSGTPIRDAVRWVASPSGVGLPWVPPIEWPGTTGSYGYVYGDVEVSDFDAGMRLFATDLGLYIHTRRDGVGELVTPQYMWDQALAQMGSAVPLTRSQAISPARWEQPAEDMPGSHWVTYRDSTGALTTNGYGSDTNNPNLRRIEYDMAHVQWMQDDRQPNSTAWIGFSRERDNGYTVPSITVDLLHLISSPTEYHRMQAKQLLEMEIGDPVYLSGDWNHTVSGINFCTGITETIQPDRWQLELSLHPAITVVGQPSPTVPPRIWESAAWPWDADARQWKEA